MKKMLFTAMMMTIAISATAMSYNAARSEALFLSDKMAHELGLTDAQYETVYEINLDYLLNVDNRSDVFGHWWDIRNRDLRIVLSPWQYDRYIASTWFYRPLSWTAAGWTFPIYSRYAMGRMFKHRPAVYVTFRGGHSHRGASFYARHHFDRPLPPHGHGNAGHHGNWTHNGNRHPVGHVGHNPSMGHSPRHAGHMGNRPQGHFGGRR